MSDFAVAWETVKITNPETTPSLTQDPRFQEASHELLHKLNGSLLEGGPLAAPSTSLNYGSAGIACALYRMACTTEDAGLLALADAWSAKAVREIPSAEAFYSQELGMTPETIGQTSLYHNAPGVFAVQAQIARARGDMATLHDAICAFIAASDRPTDKLDVTLGRAGTLLGCALLLNDASGRNAAQPGTGGMEELRIFGQTIARQLWQTVDSFAPIHESQELSNLGIAHGWAGLLYAMLCWSHTANEAVPDSLEARLDQLSALAESAGRGVRWKWDLRHPEGGHMAGWCNGSAGYVFLWTLAHKVSGREKYLEYAEGAAWDAYSCTQDALFKFSRQKRVFPRTVTLPSRHPAIPRALLPSSEFRCSGA